jgi:putative restriction endonuclease
VRDARFGRKVIAAYSGLCAMCGLDVGLVQGAHIYPASAPNSPDEAWNGLALCPTHHLAFDRHLVAVRPSDATIHYRDKMLGQYALSAAVRSLVDGTFSVLAVPPKPELRPRKDMFERRYQHFQGEYDWLSA